MKTAVELGRDIAAGKIDPVELTESTLEKIKVHPSCDDIFTILTEERGLDEAKRAQQRQKNGDLKSLLDGVPISWKDLFDTKGIATEAGSLHLKGRIPEQDCIALAHATDAGLVCVGKTHMSELAFSGLGINPKAATPPNVNGDGLAPGGSSSGAGSSVAHDLVSIGIGSDTGGSVRIPAVWNNLVGLKTTHGLISNSGVVPLCSGFDTVGPLTKSVEDAWVMTAIMAGIDLSTPDRKPLSECRFLINETVSLDDLDDDQKEGFNLAIETLKSAGAQIERRTIDLFDAVLPLGPILFPYEAWSEWGEAIEANPELMFEPVQNRFTSGKDVTEVQYKSAWAAMMSLRERYFAETSDFDAVLTPTIAIAPPSVEALMNDFELFQQTNLMALRNTRFFNMFGTCAMTLPTQKPASGIMVVGQPNQERDLTSVCLSIEDIL